MSSFPPFPEPGPTPPQENEPQYDPIPGDPFSNLPTLYPDDGPQLIPALAFPGPEEGPEIPEVHEPEEIYEGETPEID